MNTRKFSAEQLQKIDQADDLKIAPFREDGVTYGTPTWIWEVIVEGDLYVRAYHGVSSRWYQAALKQKAGRIHAAEMIKDVSFEPVSENNLNLKIDQAYQSKYSKSPYMTHMINDGARSATVKIQLINL
ncbi:DUF2255 family protein [Pedobacter sp. BMA]|uniref:DUF2255 family protein n=1 Tax=Pedobacter sp. BMA TaxID=1663685 RepID=UPI00064B1F59|nr:DUF2255 family protein [Pedobacter sp. BMA]KLT67070.1 hypothetical protein AB669_03995 [Pedobacter sp. BMA]